ncbi:hypothetical protein [Aeromicrobium sp. UC242_57]|uniref:hypothetical protein n=1 Tax=Aeromicrobium sp. UC242_57 TaxID=3374624 RepID=UPI0037A11280
MSQSAVTRRIYAVAAVVVLLVAGAFALRQLGGDDDQATPLTTQSSDAPATTTPPPTPTPEATTTTPTPQKTTGPCEGPDTQFNVEGVKQDSLLPDCGTAPVTQAEEKKAGLGLACGGSYPVILYKTTTTDAKTSICGRDASGVDFRFVTKASGGDTVDAKGSYDPDLDAFVAESSGVSYAVQAYDGTLLVTKDGSTKKQKSSDWISLDNESDYD